MGYPNHVSQSSDSHSTDIASFLLIDYPGYGECEGKPDPQTALTSSVEVGHAALVLLFGLATVGLNQKLHNNRLQDSLWNISLQYTARTQPFVSIYLGIPLAQLRSVSFFSFRLYVNSSSRRWYRAKTHLVAYMCVDLHGANKAASQPQEFCWARPIDGIARNKLRKSNSYTEFDFHFAVSVRSTGSPNCKFAAQSSCLTNNSRRSKRGFGKRRFLNRARQSDQ